jgi:hypothetical protein
MTIFKDHASDKYSEPDESNSLAYIPLTTHYKTFDLSQC